MSVLSENTTCQLDNILLQADLTTTTLYQVFEQQVNQFPDNIALIFNDEELSYRELERQVSQLAEMIKTTYRKEFGQPIAKDTLIGLYLERGFSMVVSILAVLKNGAAYVPISTEFPRERSLYIVRDTNASFVITNSINEEKIACHLLLNDG